ncbi:MAG: ribonuclease E/G [Bacteroidetes bacterium]|nr:ribonuclease E/G [Bacteroidota bacterium]
MPSKSYLFKWHLPWFHFCNYINLKHLFEESSVKRQVKGAFGKTVNLKYEAYLVLEHTEALYKLT